MPIKKELYPDNWKEISLRIRERDGQVCKFCGVPNGLYIYRFPNSDNWVCARTMSDLQEAVEKYGPLSIKDFVKIVLTVAHLDQNPANNQDENLAALCQRCHLRHDREQHARNARATREAKKLQNGQLKLVEVEN